MKKLTLVAIFIACGLVATSAPAFAQTSETTPVANWMLSSASVTWITHDDIQSSKYQEYRALPKGMSLPDLFIKGSNNGRAFLLTGRNVSQTDQRYTGFVKTDWLGVTFDYNQTPHNMGNHGHSVQTEVAPGVWTMGSTLRASLQTAVDTKLPTSTRTFPFYQSLFTPTILSASVLNVSSLRGHGNYEVDFGQKLPFGLKATYERDVKTGYRGSGGGVVYSAVNSIVELPESLDEVTQDIGLRALLNRPWGNAYASFTHNWYNNRQETTVFDNPLRPFDQAYTAASGSIPALGGPGTGRLINPPDNSANRGAFGVAFKFKKQTRLTADVAIGQWRQNAAVYPYTINSTILTTAGVRADSVAALDRQSLDGKINTTSLNFGFSSRPIDGLGLRMRYRSYDMANKTPTFVRTGSVGNAPDRSWSALTATNYAEFPLGYSTASPYGSKTGKFDAQASYDFKVLTIEGAYRFTKIDRTYREATKGEEQGGSVAAILHYNDWVMLRGLFDKGKRTASGYDPATSIGLQADESERETTRTGGEVELTPNNKMSFTLAYARRHDDYPNRPNRAAGVDGTSTGLLSAKYDTYTAEVDFTPGERADAGVFYTYEKNISTTRYGGTGSSAAPPYSPLKSMLTFDGSDKTNTYGAYASFVLVPDKWVFDVNAQHQKLDGLMDITGDPTGSFALARAAYGGIQDITDYNDTKWTTVRAELRFSATKGWDLHMGYLFDKYVFADAYSIFGNQSGSGQFDNGNENFPATGGFYLKGNDGDYKANLFYLTVSRRF